MDVGAAWKSTAPDFFAGTSVPICRVRSARRIDYPRDIVSDLWTRFFPVSYISPADNLYGDHGVTPLRPLELLINSGVSEKTALSQNVGGDVCISSIPATRRAG